MSKGVGFEEIMKILLALIIFIGIVLLVVLIQEQLNNSSNKLDEDVTKNLNRAQENFFTKIFFKIFFLTRIT